jgi:dodecin
MVVKVIEVLANSPTSWEDAAQNAVSEVSKSIREIKSVYVKDMSAQVHEGKISEYRVTCKVSFTVQG